MSIGDILWVDDEIELLKAHIIFLKNKGYDVSTVSNGADAIEMCRQKTFLKQKNQQHQRLKH